ncbi:hypothetical protein RsS62_06500 [Rhizobium dioscoreae]|uniref:hypothetical protein n=1 Tax=Rhizobium dioscoreae TaxID=2653122 RepID=UPI001288A828|nr:hypothetical protein [Rhizobium dioscoreae]GES41398.1 hypothetical protein RsS62_06500 [Rhizobium dioscoreae]
MNAPANMDLSTRDNSPMEAKAVPKLTDPDAEAFVASVIKDLVGSRIPFLVAGTYAVSAYTGISRETKDCDVFCKAGDFPRILSNFQSHGYSIEVIDERWLGKISKGRHFFDVIFASPDGATPVNDNWFEDARRFQMCDCSVRIAGATELIWSKCFVQLRHRYDGADVAHVILKAHDKIDWRKLLEYLEVNWEVLLIHLLNFRWIYPSERDKIPDWLMDELLDRLSAQRDLPLPQTKICRGRMYSRVDFEIDVKEWGFADVSGDGEWRDEEES